MFPPFGAFFQRYTTKKRLTKVSESPWDSDDQLIFYFSRKKKQSRFGNPYVFHPAMGKKNQLSLTRIFFCADVSCTEKDMFHKFHPFEITYPVILDDSIGFFSSSFGRKLLSSLAPWLSQYVWGRIVWGPGAYTTRSLVQDEEDGSTWKHQRWEWFECNCSSWVFRRSF